MAKSALPDAHRINAFLVDPTDLKIIDDPKHHLYDERVKLPLDENMVLNIMAFGVKEAVLATKEGEDVVVVNGRQRVKHAIEANKRLRAQGKEPLRVRVLLEKGTEADLFGVTAFTNEFRRDDSILGKVAKIQRLLAMGKTEEECRVIYGISKGTLVNWLALLEASAPVRKAVETGKIGAIAAAEIAKLPRDKQEPALDKAVAAGGTLATARREVASSKGKEIKERPTLSELKAALEAMEGYAAKSDEEDQAILQTLAWVLGERKTPHEKLKAALKNVQPEKASA